MNVLRVFKELFEPLIVEMLQLLPQQELSRTCWTAWALPFFFEAFVQKDDD